MKRILPILILLSFSIPSYAEEVGCGIGVIPKKLIEYGCGCGYWLATKPTLKPLLQTEYFDFKKSYMYINGELVLMEPVKVEKMPMNPKVGDKFSQHYKFGDTEIVFNNTISFVCTPSGENCEVTSFNTTATISKLKCKIEVKKLTGDCGC